LGMIAPLMLTDTVAEEARSVVASALTQIINMLRTILAYAMEVIRRFMAWMGEHPRASVHLIATVCAFLA